MPKKHHDEVAGGTQLVVRTELFQVDFSNRAALPKKGAAPIPGRRWSPIDESVAETSWQQRDQEEFCCRRTLNPSPRETRGAITPSSPRRTYLSYLHRDHRNRSPIHAFYRKRDPFASLTCGKNIQQR